MFELISMCGGNAFSTKIKNIDFNNIKNKKINFDICTNIFLKFKFKSYNISIFKSGYIIIRDIKDVKLANKILKDLFS
jgi:hypothetical protein